MSTTRNLFAIVASAVAAALMIGAVAAPAASASEECSNEARRVEQGSTFLPDCRAYELVSQPYQPSPFHPPYIDELPPISPTTLGEWNELPRKLPEAVGQESVAIDGNAALFGSVEPNGEGEDTFDNLSIRKPNGWVGENIEPRQSRHDFLCGGNIYVGYSQNLEEIAFNDGFSEDENRAEFNVEDCGHEEPRLVPGESEESANLFVRDTATGSFQLVNVAAAGAKQKHDPWFDAMSSDGSHVVFQSRAQLTPDAPSELPGNHEYCSGEFGDVYVWSAGSVHVLTVLPDGSPVPGPLAGTHLYTSSCGGLSPNQAGFTHSVSVDGERMLFYAGGGYELTYVGSFPEVRPEATYVHGGLYLREHASAEQSALGKCSEAEQTAEPGKACTVQIDMPQAGASGSTGGGQFQWANATTTKIFFTDEQRLTVDSTAQAGKPDLYEYDVERPEGQRLADLTVDASEPADVLGVSGASEDGAYVYFVANGVLTAGQENSHHAKAAAGQANLYLRHGGTTTFVATLDAAGGDRCDWTWRCLSSRVSSNGAFIAFDSVDSLTGYDNHPVRPDACKYLLNDTTGEPCMETFRYASATGELTCATCNPTGAPPASEFAWSVIQYPTNNTTGTEGGHNYAMRINHTVSANGEVFFDTMEKLVPADENETWDVYEYSGGEGASSELHLISSGKSEQPSYFVDATPDGSNVFFLTFQSLLRADTRTDYDLYDARIGGGFAAQDEPVVPPSCEALEACRSPLSEPPAELSAASAALSGGGNLAVAPELPGVEKPAKKSLTRKQRLARSLSACIKRYRHKPMARHGCEHQARRGYGAMMNAHRHNGEGR